MRRILTRFVLPAGLLLLLFLAQAPAAGDGIRPDFFAPGGPLDRPEPAVAAALPGGESLGATGTGDVGLSLLFRMGAGLGVVGLLGYALYRITLRLRGAGLVASPIFRPLAVQAIAPGAFLQVVEIGNKAIVLAVSEKSVVPVTEISDPEELASLRFSISQRATGGSFRQAVTAAWNKTRGETELPPPAVEEAEITQMEKEEKEALRLLLGRLRAERERLEGLATPQR